MIDVVVDTNVYIDALFRGHSEAESLLRNERLGFYRFVLSDRMRNELVKVLEAHLIRAKLPPEDMASVVAIMTGCMHRARLFNSRRRVHLSCDEPDNEFIACAIEAPSDYLVTSNHTHFQDILEAPIINNAGRTIRILYPDEFNLEMLKAKMSSKR